MAPIDSGFRKRLQSALNLWIDQTERHLIRAKKNGYLNKTANPRAMAYFVVMAHEGFYGMIKGLDDPKAFKSLYDSINHYFKSFN